MPDASRPDMHDMPVRVYYEDTDAGGIVYYANYLKFAERARTELLRSYGFDQAVLMKERRLAFAVRTCTAEYLKPSVLDDRLRVRTRVYDVKGATLQMSQDIVRDTDLLVQVNVRLACMNIDTGAPTRIPADIRAHFAECATTKTTG